MRTVFPRLKAPLNARSFLDITRATMRSGVVEGCEVTKGTSGWLVSINAGKVIIDGTYVHEDLVKTDHSSLGHLVGSDAHYAVYQTYAYADSDPASASGFLIAVAAPPLQPVVPGGGVKLADIFVPAAATSILDASVRVVNAPRLPTRADSGEIVERLVSSMASTMLYTTGAVNYDDTTGIIAVSQELVAQATVSTHRQQFGTGPALVRGKIAAGNYSAPGTAGSRDVLIYTIFDRSTPNENLPLTLKFLDRSAPNLTLVSELLDPANVSKILILGVVIGDRMTLSELQGQLPPPVADTRKFLRNAPTGQHLWDLIKDSDVAGGFKAAVADITARNAIPSDVRRDGMQAYVQSTGLYYALKGGITNSDWQISNRANFLQGGYHVAANAAGRAAIPAALLEPGTLCFQLDTNAEYMWINNILPGDAQIWQLQLYRPWGGGVGVPRIALNDSIDIVIDPQQITAISEQAYPVGGTRGNVASRVIKGLELLPSSSVSFPTARLRPGVGLVAARDVAAVTVATEVTVNLAAASMIGGGTPTFPGNFFGFLRKDGTLRFSQSAPDIRGCPSAADATFAVTDYCYVGFLRCKGGIGSDYATRWGTFSVSHDGNGMRLVTFDKTDAALFGDTVESSWTTSGPDTSTVNVGPNSATTLLPTAIDFIVTDKAYVVPIQSGTPGYLKIEAEFAGGVLEAHGADLVTAPSGGAVPLSIQMSSHRVPSRSLMKAVVTVERTGGASARGWGVSSRIVGMTENVNHPLPIRQPAFV